MAQQIVPPAPAVKHPQTQTTGSSEDPDRLFTIKRKSTGEPEAVVFNSHAKGRAPHKVSGRVVNNVEPRKDVAQPVEIPLLHLLRKLTRGSLDIEMPIGLVFGQLGRLRALQKDTAALNRSTPEELEKDPELSDRVNRLLEMVSGLGFTLPASGKAPLEIEELDSFIATIEQEYQDIIKSTQEALANGWAIEYMGLQELYTIGSIVTSRNVGGIGGALVGLRVVDSYFEPLRSLLGGRRFSYHLALETLVAMAGEFVAVTFEVVMEDWTGGKDPSSLQFKPLTPGDVPDLEHRHIVLQSLAGRPAYKRYRAGSFFPHVGGRLQNRGAATADHKLAAPGRLVVDTRRGLELGHAPASAIDEAGLAIAAGIKAYRNTQRSKDETESEEKRAERLKAVGLRLWSNVPPVMRLQCWPTVVAFSLMIKQWGHVVVDGLETVPYSSEAWKQLVLPPRTKEMLMAMAASTLRGESCLAAKFDSADEEVRSLLERLQREPRYRFRDIIEGKGGGVLFLLYGPPGTGSRLFF